jgi:spermidine synthase
MTKALPIESARAAWALLLIGLSGAAALGWQWVWTTQLGAALGHEVVAVLATMAAFFAGLALGALLLGRVIERSARPQQWYVACELVMALWGALLCLIGPQLMSQAAALIGPEPSALWHWGVAFALPGLLLLPATAAMGVTLPALERAVRAGRRRSSGLGGLYAANTLGAVVGVLLVVFLALPQWGVLRTGLACAAINAGCALLAIGLWRRAPLVAQVQAPLPPVAKSRQWLWIGGLLFGTGLLGIGYEVLAVRVLSQVTENTIYSQAVLLAVYLLGTALGAAVYQRWRGSASAQAGRDFAQGGEADKTTLSHLLASLALAMLIGGASLWWAQDLCAWPAQQWGVAPWTALAGEAMAAAVAMAAPTLLMGALFTHLCLFAQARGWVLGRTLALNTTGAALAPLLLGVVVLPTVGASTGLALLVLGYAVLQQRWRTPTAWGPALVAGMLLLWAPPLRFIEQAPDASLISYQDGVMAAVSVVQDGQGVSRLRINNRAQEGSSASAWLEWRLAQMPLLLHANSRSATLPKFQTERHALFLGLGTGFTAAAAGSDARVQVDVVELLPEVIEAADFFTRSPNAPRPGLPLHIVAADARRFVQAGDSRYDVIVADLFHPARNGAGTLYTVEQFAAVRQRLAPGGLFCQWLALHQMEIGTLRSIVAAFLQVYPQGVAVLASNSLDTPVLGLIARPDAPRLFADATLDGGPAGQAARQHARLDDDFSLLGSLLAGPTALANFSRHAEVNTDDRPLVVHSAPWDTYAPQTTPRQRLLSLIHALAPQAADLFVDSDSPAAQRLSAYWSARQRYLEIGMQVQAGGDAAAMLAQVEGALLAVLDLSADFKPARDALTALAASVAARDPNRARAVMDELQARAPAVSPGPSLQANRL